MTDLPFTPEVETGGWQVARDEDAWGRYTIEGFVEPDYTIEDILVRAEAEDAANANLIAAAPRMYRLLKDLAEIRPLVMADRAQELLDWIDNRG